MSFLKDKKDGEIAENIIEKFLLKNNKNIKLEKSVGKNPDWDFRIFYKNGVVKTCEVKFDKMSLDTGNFAFELANDRGPSGLRKSKADIVYYVLPTSEGFFIYEFNRENLLDYLLKNKSIRIVYGGDGKRFKLALLPIKDISIGEKYLWVVNKN